MQQNEPNVVKFVRETTDASVCAIGSSTAETDNLSFISKNAVLVTTAVLYPIVQVVSRNDFTTTDRPINS